MYLDAFAMGTAANYALMTQSIIIKRTFSPNNSFLLVPLDVHLETQGRQPPLDKIGSNDINDYWG